MLGSPLPQLVRPGLTEVWLDAVRSLWEGSDKSDRAAGAPARGQRMIVTTAEAVRPTVARKSNRMVRRLPLPRKRCGANPLEDDHETSSCNHVGANSLRHTPNSR